MSIYVKDADGSRRKVAGVGLPGPAGKSAYQYAVEGGFTGTEDEFKALMGVRSNPNLLDNAYWASRDRVINQRGKNLYPASPTHIYTIDRLVSVKTAVEVKDNGLAFTPDLTMGDIGWLDWRLDGDEVCGKTVTLSALIDGELYSFSDVFPSEAGQEKYSNLINGVRLYTANTMAHPVAGILFYEQREYLAKAAKLELGPVQTLAHKEGDAWVLTDPPPDKALELLKCQRYFVRVYYDQYDTIGISSSNSEWIGLIMPLPTNMRLKQPSVSVTCHPKRISDNLELPAPSGCTVSGAVATVQFYHSGSTIAAYVFAAQQGYIEFDANL